MKVKDLIKLLKKEDPEAIAVVQEYNGCDDGCRPVERLKTTDNGDEFVIADSNHVRKRLSRKKLVLITNLNY